MDKTLDTLTFNLYGSHICSQIIHLYEMKKNVTISGIEIK